MSVITAPLASEELTPVPPPRKGRESSPIPPPRRKRANSSYSPKRHHAAAAINSLSCNNKDSPAANARRGDERSSLPPIANKLCPPSSVDPSSTKKLESNITRTVGLRREEWMMKSNSSKSLPRVENYYTRTSPEMIRRTSAPLMSTFVVSPSTSCAATATTEKCATPSPTHVTAPAAAVEKESPTRSKRPSTGPATPKDSDTINTSINNASSSNSNRPNRPPKPPTPAPYSSTRNRFAPFSQLYSGRTALADTASASVTTIVIDSKDAGDAGGGERSLSMAPRNYGKMSGPHTKSGQGSNRDHASIVYGKKTQAALNKLVAAVKRFQGTGSSHGAGQKTRKSNPNKTPPKRPPPAVRNTPRPPAPKMSADCGEDSAWATCSIDSNNEEENPYVNSYDDHIYMEVGSKLVSKLSIAAEGSRRAVLEGPGGDRDDDDNDDDAYVIMNSGESPHIYTPLAFGMRSKSTENVYQALQVTRSSSQECAAGTTSLGGSDSMDDDDAYVSPEELKRYRVVTSIGDEEDSNSAIEDGKEANKNSNYGKDDAMYETVQYENAAASVATSYKQSSAHGGKLSPTKSVTPTHKIVTDR